MNRIAIVIINYESYYETEKCVESIINKRLSVVGIVIIDNASSNKSFSYLQKKYQEIPNIKVIRTNKNYGFAKGNNIGIKLAKNLWKADFVLLLNSDTIILEDDYLAKILNAYEPGIGVIQSNVLRINGRYTKKNYGTYNLSGLIFEMMQDLCSYYNFYFPKALKKNVTKQLGPWISGCDLFLTPDYFNFFNGLYPLTFLYGEEYILATLLKKAHLEWKIVGDAHLLHAESKSTPFDFMLGTLKKHKLDLLVWPHKLLARILPGKILCRIINTGRW